MRNLPKRDLSGLGRILAGLLKPAGNQGFAAILAAAASGKKFLAGLGRLLA